MNTSTPQNASSFSVAALDWPLIIVIILIVAAIAIWLWWDDVDDDDYQQRSQIKVKQNNRMDKTGIWPFARSQAQAVTHVTQIIPKKRYIQLQDTHIAKTGMIWEYNENSGYGYVPLNDELRQPAVIGISCKEGISAIEKNPEWFEELVPVYVNKDMMQKIGTLALNKGN